MRQRIIYDYKSGDTEECETQRGELEYDRTTGVVLGDNAQRVGRVTCLNNQKCNI